MAELLVELQRELEAGHGAAAAIRASVAHGVSALGATAASMFLLSPDGNILHGAFIGWDWTRTSFEVPLAAWPNVRRAVDSNTSVHFAATEAEASEQGWFEQRGIGATTCTPMTVGGRVLGVLFFDYADVPRRDADRDIAERVAEQCALLVRSVEERLRSGAAPSSGPSARDR